MAVKTGSQILYNLLLKEAVKGSGQASGIMSIGDSVRKLAEKRLQSYLLAAQKQGVDLDKLGEQEIKYMLELNKKPNYRVISQDDPEFVSFRDQILGKKNRDNVIQGKFGKPFKEEIGSVDNIINNITRMEPVAALKEVNKVLRREGKYKNLSKQDSEKVFNDTNDWINQRDQSDLYDYKNKRPFREDPNFDPDDPDFDPENFADGGRIGFAEGNGVYDEDVAKKKFAERVKRLIDEGYDFGEAVKQAMKEEGFADGGRTGYYLGSMVGRARQQKDGIESRLEKLGGDVTSAEQMLQGINKRLESAGSSIPEGGGASIANYTPQPRPSYTPQLPVDFKYGEGPAGGLGTLATLAGSNQPFNPGNFQPSIPNNQMPPGFGTRPLLTATIDPNFKPVEQLKAVRPSGPTTFTSVEDAYGAAKKSAQERRKGGFAGQVVLPGEQTFKDFSNFYDPSNPFGFSGLKEIPASGGGMQSSLQTASSQENLQNTLPGLFADGGVAGLLGERPGYDEGKEVINYDNDANYRGWKKLYEVNPDIAAMNKNHSKYEQYYKSKQNSKALGGRVPFAMGRRAFLKLLGVGGAGIGALKTGIGLGGKKAATEVAKDVATEAAGTYPPPYFFNLVNKIKTLGDDTLASKDKAIAKKYKDYTMEEDFAGNIEIIKKGGDDMFPEDVYMSYKVDEVPLRGRGKKGSTKVEEYEEYTARPDQEGKMKDVEQGVPDEVIEEGTVFEDNMTDFGKADGGIARMLGE
jgi:hypothetical protein